MDIFKQKRNLGLAVILLVILNLFTLTVLWIGRPGQREQSRGSRNPIEERNRIQNLLQNELGFDKIQTEQYLRLRQDHHEQVLQLEDEIRQIKKQMFDEVLKDDPQPKISDSLLRSVQEKQADIEQVTFKHFLDLKKLCKPEQQDKLKLLMNELFRTRRDGPPSRSPRND